MTTLTAVLASVCALLAIFFMAVRVTKAPIYGLLTKTVASMAFVAMGAIAVLLGARRGMPFGAQLVVLGLSYGMVGDIVLDLKRAHSEFENKYLVSGMLSFALGHAAYIAAIVLVARQSAFISGLQLPVLISAVIAAAVSPVVMIVSIKFMKARYGKFLGISAAYAALLIFVTIFTVWLTVLDTSFLLIALGMIAFLLSDLVLSTMYFVEGKKEDKLLVIVNHSLYYAAQILIACWLFSLI